MDATNYIAKLHELAQKNRWLLKFEDVDYVGPDHLRTFTVRAVVDGKAYANGVGKNKKEARQMASKNALEVVLSDPAPELKEAAPSSVPPSPGFADTNFIGILNHYCQKKNLLHDFVFEKRTGPPHDPQFFFKVVIDKKDYPLAEGKSVKIAKQKAAQMAYSTLQEQSDWDSKVSIRSSEDSPAQLLTPAVSNPVAQDANKNVRAISTSDSVITSHAVSPPKHKAVSPDVKPKIKSRLAANFPNANKSKEDIMPNLTIKKNVIPVEKTPPQPINSRFVSDYDSIEALGKGAFGTVFKARQKLLEKYFAIKIIRCKEKTLREVKALSDLSHVNIVRYYTCWMEDTAYQWDSSIDSYSSSQSTGNQSEKYLYVEMELCDTKTLRVWIDEKNTQNVKKSRRDPRRREESLKIAQQLVTGVEYIHSLALIHRDLKPANVLFGRDGNVKIGDFGLVTAESTDEENVIERTVYKGTPSYMAPEQMNRKTYDRKVDIFALGLIYFELLWNIVTGQERQAIWDELKVQKLPEDFTRYFQQEGQIIKSMLSGQPQDRPEAKKVMQELEECSQLLTMFKSMRTV
ncbi:interferon-induced, double-stranded RNA-activated protein kinase-like isoform X3 [Periophthalmus magnuspinnatus]|uniref:interferon-induced, double-stranded RNA-activated protein kinase-like isoform X3 n=1 Tax=Periophthalmus magnuspinnatus TaxID=409849 RepID=UPI0024370E96|nr:interferon-induced, double-stranded RNA-activated protein kinase-like isoform X3 [Periophthalmus magnuspinnatus]